jgi:hypothetical protein
MVRSMNPSALVRTVDRSASRRLRTDELSRLSVESRYTYLGQADK